jgi:hypothetical protein
LRPGTVKSITGTPATLPPIRPPDTRYSQVRALLPAAFNRLAIELTLVQYAEAGAV